MLTPYLMYIKLGLVAAIVAAVYFFGHHQGYQGEHDKFVTFQAKVTALGHAQAAKVKAIESANQTLKEKYDAENKRLEHDNLDLAMQLLNSRTRGSYLPKAAPASKRPDAACFNRLQLESAIRSLDAGVQSLITKGDTAIIGLNAARGWAQNH